MYNASIFNKDEVESLIQSANVSLLIDKQEVEQKGAEVPVILILKFSGAAIAAGFFGKIGADLYDGFKGGLKRLIANKKQVDQSSKIHVMFKMGLGAGLIDIVVELTSSINIAKTSEESINLDSAKKYIRRIVGKSQIKKVVLTLCNEGERGQTKWKMKYFIDEDDQIVNFS